MHHHLLLCRASWHSGAIVSNLDRAFFSFGTAVFRRLVGCSTGKVSVTTASLKKSKFICVPSSSNGPDLNFPLGCQDLNSVGRMPRILSRPWCTALPTNTVFHFLRTCRHKILLCKTHDHFADGLCHLTSSSHTPPTIFGSIR